MNVVDKGMGLTENDKGPGSEFPSRMKRHRPQDFAFFWRGRRTQNRERRYFSVAVVVVVTALAGCDSSASDACSTPQSEQEDRSTLWTFKDVALEAGAQEADARNRGAGAADFDGDGDIDLWLTNLGDGSTLLLNDGAGAFKQQSVPHTSWGTAVAIADYDGDGDPDVFEACGGFSSTCSNGLFRNDGLTTNGTLQFTDVSELSGIGEAERANHGGAWQDYDLDGDLDLFVASKDIRSFCAISIQQLWQAFEERPPLDFGASSEDLLYRNRGDGTFEEVAKLAGVASAGDGHQGAWLDYNGDHFPDLFVPVFKGDNLLYRNNGDGSFEKVTPEALKKPLLAFGAIAEDFDNDGFVDLLVAARHSENEETFLGISAERHGLYLNDGLGGFTQLAEDSGLFNLETLEGLGGVMGFQSGDFNLDGWLDVVFGNGGPFEGGKEQNILMSSSMPRGGSLTWTNLSHMIQVEPDAVDGAGEALVYPYRTHGAVFFDYDLDGRIDLFLGNGAIYPHQREPNRLFRNTSESQNHWLGVDLVGLGLNRDAIGARVRVSNVSESCEEWAFYRQLNHTSGFNSTAPHILKIGLGAHRPPYNLTIWWPNGEEQSMNIVEGDRIVQVIQQN